MIFSIANFKSKSEAICKLLGKLYHELQNRQVALAMTWVPSEDNLADVYTRLDPEGNIVAWSEGINGMAAYEQKSWKELFAVQASSPLTEEEVRVFQGSV